MKVKYIEKPYNKFIQLRKNDEYTIVDHINVSEKKAKKLIEKLSKYCYLITYQGSKFFDIEEIFYDTDNKNYQRLIDLNRPKTLEIKLQKIFLNEIESENYLVINTKQFHKNSEIKLKLKREPEDWQVNQILQQENISLPLLSPSYILSYTRILLYQPHNQTTVYIDLDIYPEINHKKNAKITVISNKRKNPITKLIKKQLKSRKNYPQTVSSY